MHFVLIKGSSALYRIRNAEKRIEKRLVWTPVTGTSTVTDCISYQKRLEL